MVDDDGLLRGLITVKDIQKQIQYPDSTKDEQGRLRGRAPPSAPAPTALERAAALVEAGVDVLVVDTAHGHCQGVLDVVKPIKDRHGDQVDVIAGNVATAEGRRRPRSTPAPTPSRSASARARSAPPGSSPASASPRSPRSTTAPWPPPGTASPSSPTAASSTRATSPRRIAAGADAVMLGSLLAGVDESPGEVVLHQGERFKEYRGMGSMGAMKARSFSKDRYFQGDVTDAEKLVPEGIEGRVAYKGPLANVVYQLVGGLRAAMGYCGAADRRRAPGPGPLRPHHRRRPAREPPPRRHDHQGSPQLRHLGLTRGETWAGSSPSRPSDLRLRAWRPSDRRPFAALNVDPA